MKYISTFFHTNQVKLILYKFPDALLYDSMLYALWIKKWLIVFKNYECMAVDDAKIKRRQK